MWPHSRRYYSGRDLARIATIDDLQHAAHSRLPDFIAEYLEGGAEDEVTLRRNRDAFEQRTFAPRMLVDVSAPDLSTILFGVRHPLPIIIGPTGLNGLLTDQGDVKLAAAASSAGIPFVQSTVSMASIETVAAQLNTPHWMQLYVLRNRDFTRYLIERALAANSAALMLTVDGPVYGNRAWDKRNYVRPAVIGWRQRFNALAHPAWLADIWLRGKGPSFVNVESFIGKELSAAQTAEWLRNEMDASLTWQDVTWLRQHWPRKLIIKGILRPDDVERAIDAGADGVVISNHGGRQLDLVGAPINLLPAAVTQARGRIPVFIDSGFRRGSDIAQAIALGAAAVLIGRATLYGIAAGGTAGASRAITILAEELQRVVALLGRRSLAELDTSIFASLENESPS